MSDGVKKEETWQERDARILALNIAEQQDVQRHRRMIEALLEDWNRLSERLIQAQGDQARALEKIAASLGKAS